jgi:hypothetical protein
MCIARVEHCKDASSNDRKLAYMLAEGELESIGEDYCARLVIDGPWHVNVEVGIVFAGREALNEGCPSSVRLFHCKGGGKNKKAGIHLIKNVADPKDTRSSLLNDSSNAR